MHVEFNNMLSTPFVIYPFGDISIVNTYVMCKDSLACNISSSISTCLCECELKQKSRSLYEGMTKF